MTLTLIVLVNKALFLDWSIIVKKPTEKQWDIERTSQLFIAFYASGFGDNGFGGGDFGGRGGWGGGGGGGNNGFIVRMRGLPFRVTENEIAEWFSSVADPVGINIQWV